MVYVTLSTGIGSGIVLDGKLFLGTVPLLGNWDTISLIPAVRSAIAATTAVGRYLLLEQPSDSRHPSECLPSQVSYQNWLRLMLE